ncbi:YdeI family protein [uncultured Deinococcus sp.]|uniref:YdeI/OmpD-associated family protein n=1 Tax=uncultured Deinococcus sp. TaxID=158789 RepID=UPI0025FC8D3F|nr:YdeI/OmpD-associated family protein [uncultured Deinococcus sp.]
MTPATPAELVEPASRAAWRAWLQANHATSRGVRLVLHKKGSPTPNLSSAEAVEEALCFGWIDSRPGRLDGHRSFLTFTPRRPGSGWSAVNKERIARLQAGGLMTPAGQARIDAAIADGTWTKLDSVAALEVPDDLRAALEARPGAAASWEAFPVSAKRAVLEWIVHAKTGATREKRVTEAAEKAARGERANQWRRP